MTERPTKGDRYNWSHTLIRTDWQPSDVCVCGHIRKLHDGDYSDCTEPDEDYGCGCTWFLDERDADHHRPREEAYQEYWARYRENVGGQS